jgi:hypothetical protein
MFQRTRARDLQTILSCLVLITLTISATGSISGSPTALAGSTVGSFEIDGNLADDSGPGEPIDWATAPNVLNFSDASGQADSIFGQGTKELEPGGWTCTTGSAPGKDDIVKGAIAFRTLGGKQYLLITFQRASANGDAHMDFEFNQSADANSNCPEVPRRTAGDVVVTFDTDNGGKTILVRAFKWQGNAVSGTFTELPLGSRGVLWDGAVNIPNTIPGLDAGTFGEAVLNLTDSPVGEIGCQLFATGYVKSRASTAINSELKDRTAVQRLDFALPEPQRANAAGSALTARVQDTLLGLNQSLVSVSTSQSGVGAQTRSDQLLNVALPAPGGEVLRADVLRSSSGSVVTASPAEASQTSTAEAANLNVMNGLVTASAVRAVATARASGNSSSVSSVGSVLKDVTVRGAAMGDAAPNTRVDLPPDLFGPGSYVVLNERTASTSRPAPTQTSGGTYAADLEVNMIRVHITDELPLVAGNQALDVTVANAKAHADFPQITVCPGAPLQAVSGHAYVLREANDVLTIPVTHGFVSILPTGGHDHQDLAQASTSAASAGAAVTDSNGALSPTSASSYAQAAGLCIASAPSGCTIAAQLVKSQANSSGGSSSASSNDNGTNFVGLSVLGTPTTVGASRNQVVELPGIGFVILDEQFCDNGAALPNCAGGSAAGSSGLTVRAIHLVVTVPSNPTGLRAGTEAIVAEAHADVLSR